MRTWQLIVAAFLVGVAVGVMTHRTGVFQHVRESLGSKELDTSASYTHRLKVPFHVAYPSRSDVVMVGDSLTESADWSALFPRCKIANYGIAGDTSWGMLERVDTIISTGASRAIIMLGANDVLRGFPEDLTLINAEALVTALRSAGMSVTLQSTLYTNRQDDTAKIDRINDGLTKLCKRVGCSYVDLNAKLSAGGVLRPEYVFEGVHINALAYGVWRDHVGSYICPKS